MKLIGEEEFVAAGGVREKTNAVDRASEQFVSEFTAKYPELAARVPVYAQLRSLIDMAVAAAFIQQQDYYGKADWRMPVFGDESTFPVATGQAPKQAPTAVNSLWKGRTLLTPVGGGVEISASRALTRENLITTDREEVSKVRDSIELKDLPEGKWWWD